MAVGGQKTDYATMGMMLECNNGVLKLPIILLPGHGTYSKTMGLVVDSDIKPFVNIMPFGVCRALQMKPCLYAPTGKWQKVASKFTLNGEPVVLATSQLCCALGGVIKFCK